MQTVLNANNVTLATAVAILKLEGFDANPSVTNIGWIDVVDGGKVLLMHPCRVFAFIEERS